MNLSIYQGLTRIHFEIGGESRTSQTPVKRNLIRIRQKNQVTSFIENPKNPYAINRNRYINPTKKLRNIILREVLPQNNPTLLVGPVTPSKRHAVLERTVLSLVYGLMLCGPSSSAWATPRVSPRDHSWGGRSHGCRWRHDYAADALGAAAVALVGATVMVLVSTAVDGLCHHAFRG